MKFFPVIMFSVMLGANIYVAYRIWHILPVGIVARILVVVAVLILMSSLFIIFSMGDMMPSSVLSVMYRFSTSWQIVLLYLFIIFLLLDILRVTHVLPLDQYMFNSWTGTGIIAAIMLLLLGGGYWKYIHKDRVELNLAVVDEKRSEQPLKIVGLSDMHLGYGIDKKEFEKWAQLINDEEPDVVIIAGDVIDNNIRPLMEQNMAEVFQKIKSKYGIYVAPGNHEYISGIENSLRFFKDAGITVLRDSCAFIDNRFYIAGRDDRTNQQRKSIKDLTEELDPTKPCILLDHQPYHLEESEHNHIDLLFCGHTHRGQVWPISWVTDKIYENSHGYLKKGNTHTYVSSGLGLWGGKFRIGTQSEYVVINLR